MALVHFKLKGRKVIPLPFAKELPEQGDTVYTFGSPVGQPNVIAPGMVSSVRTGKEVAALMDRLGKDVYVKAMRYTMDANWIQHTAPMSHGNSGGPLVNEKGEVVGLNTMNFAAEGTANSGQALNYAISATHLDKLLQAANKSNVKAWSTLPAPREHEGIAILGDIGRTLTVWKEMNRALNYIEHESRRLRGEVQEDPQGQSRQADGGTERPNEEEGKNMRRIVRRVQGICRQKSEQSIR